MKRETARQKGRAVSGSFRPRAAPARAAAASRVPPPPAGPPHSRPGPARPSRRPCVAARSLQLSAPAAGVPPSRALPFPPLLRGSSGSSGSASLSPAGIGRSAGGRAVPGSLRLYPTPMLCCRLPSSLLPPREQPRIALRGGTGPDPPIEERTERRGMSGVRTDFCPRRPRGREGRSHPPADSRPRAHLLEEKRGSGLVPYHPVAEALFRMVSW